MNIIDYGVCRLSIVSVRKDPNHRSELTTQLLFGDDYEVLERSEDKLWLKIRIHFDHYEGWIDSRQHHTITREHFDYISRADFKVSTDLTSSILYNKTPLPIVMGSIIPISSTELFKMEEQFAFNGEAKSIGQKREFEFLRAIAVKYLNAPYLWGGKSPFGMDCSGFVQMVFKISGYRLPRDAWQQALHGKPVHEFSEVQFGDVAFFKNDEEKIVHTGIVIGENKIIHASGRVRIDYFNEEGIVNVETRSYSHTFAYVRRILA
jgi:gamma-D-glutamyl-L-lysine dipeptidyl-peptidase